MPDVKATFDKREISIMAFIIEQARENNILENLDFKELGLVNVEKIFNKLYYRIVGLSATANKKNNEKINYNFDE